jgi:hypothetical protein
MFPIPDSELASITKRAADARRQNVGQSNTFLAHDLFSWMRHATKCRNMRHEAEDKSVFISLVENDCLLEYEQLLEQ